MYLCEGDVFFDRIGLLMMKFHNTIESIGRKQCYVCDRIAPLDDILIYY